MSDIIPLWSIYRFQIRLDFEMTQFKKQLENFWYHYKWTVVISLISVISLLVCMVQCTGKDEYDMYALYAGPFYFGGDQSAQLRDAVNDYMDGEHQEVCVNSFVYVSEQKKQEYKEGDAYINDGINLQQTSDFFDFLYTSSFNMLILDSELYSLINKEDLLTPISDISMQSSALSSDGYSINLSDTDLKDKYSIFKSLPQDTVLCFRKNVLMQKLSSGNDRSSYNYQKNIFKKIIEK